MASLSPLEAAWITQTGGRSFPLWMGSVIFLSLLSMGDQVVLSLSATTNPAGACSAR